MPWLRAPTVFPVTSFVAAASGDVSNVETCKPASAPVSSDSRQKARKTNTRAKRGSKSTRSQNAHESSDPTPAATIPVVARDTVKTSKAVKCPGVSNVYAYMFSATFVYGYLCTRCNCRACAGNACGYSVVDHHKPNIGTRRLWREVLGCTYASPPWFWHWQSSLRWHVACTWSHVFRAWGLRVVGGWPHEADSRLGHVQCSRACLGRLRSIANASPGAPCSMAAHPRAQPQCSWLVHST